MQHNYVATQRLQLRQWNHNEAQFWTIINIALVPNLLDDLVKL